MGQLVHTGEAFVSARHRRFGLYDEGWAQPWIWLRVLTLVRRFVHRSTKAHPATTTPMLIRHTKYHAEARQNYVNPGAGLPIRSADVCPNNDEDADVSPLTRNRGVRYDN